MDVFSDGAIEMDVGNIWFWIGVPSRVGVFPYTYKDLINWLLVAPRRLPNLTNWRLSIDIQTCKQTEVMISSLEQIAFRKKWSLPFLMVQSLSPLDASAALSILNKLRARRRKSVFCLELLIYIIHIRVLVIKSSAYTDKNKQTNKKKNQTRFLCDIQGSRNSYS